MQKDIFRNKIKNLQIIRDNFYRAGFIQAGKQVQNDIYKLVNKDLKNTYKRYKVIESCKYTDKTINIFEFRCEWRAENKMLELIESNNYIQGHTEVVLID